MTRTLEIVRAFARREARTRPALGAELGFLVLESALPVAVLWQLSQWMGTPVAGARDYLTFAGPPVVLVGFALAAMIAAAAGIARARRSGAFEALLVTAATPVSVALGMLAYPAASMFLRALLACGLLLALGLAPLGWGALAALVSLTLAFAVVAPCAMLLQAAVIARPGALRAGVMAALAGTLLSGALFPLSELPGGLGGAADLFPFRAMVQAIRLSYSGAPPASLTQAWTTLLLWLGLLIPLSWIALDAAFRRARRVGRMRAA
jgi:ABC-type multidrug transport system permease subunit